MSLGWRAATNADRASLAHFRCANGDAPWEREVEDFIRVDLPTWVTAADAAGDDPRVLVLRESAHSKPLGTIVHHRSELSAGPLEMPARHIQVMALHVDAQGSADVHGVRFSDALVSAALLDIAEREPAELVYAVVHRANARSLAVLERSGIARRFPAPHPAYLLVVS